MQSFSWFDNDIGLQEIGKMVTLRHKPLKRIETIFISLFVPKVNISPNLLFFRVQIVGKNLQGNYNQNCFVITMKNPFFYLHIETFGTEVIDRT